jgi:hypothetical protein
MRGRAEQSGASISEVFRVGSVVLSACKMTFLTGFRPGKGGQTACVRRPLGTQWRSVDASNRPTQDDCRTCCDVLGMKPCGAAW